jgi:hypothetical protein
MVAQGISPGFRLAVGAAGSAPAPVADQSKVGDEGLPDAQQPAVLLGPARVLRLAEPEDHRGRRACRAVAGCRIRADRLRLRVRRARVGRPIHPFDPT